MIGADREQSALIRLQEIRKDPLVFLSYVKTQDQVDRLHPVKKFPVHLDYIKQYVKLWVKEDRIAVPKSRRMLMSWTNVCLVLWDTMWGLGRNWAVVSKKEDDADELIRRMKFVLENLVLPPDIPVPKWSYKFAKIGFPELDSHVQGFPQGADQLRQFTFSGIMADEMAFWDNAQEMYSASVPTLEGGGKFIAISSPGPGFFKRLVFDQLEHEGW